MKPLHKLIHVTLGEYYRHKFDLWQRSRRLRQAKELAMELHEQHNGMRFWVLENDTMPGHFQVWSWPQIKAGIRAGTFSKRANIMDFFREAAWYTPVGTKLILEKKKRKETDRTVMIISLVTLLLFLLAIGLLNYFGLLTY